MKGRRIPFEMIYLYVFSPPPQPLIYRIHFLFSSSWEQMSHPRCNNDDFDASPQSWGTRSRLALPQYRMYSGTSFTSFSPLETFA